MKTYYIYIMTNQSNTTLYIGMTNDIYRRAQEHKESIIPGFTQQYRIKKLVYVEEYHNVIDAIRREKQLKKWNRVWKIRLIEQLNPQWKDLYGG